MTLLDGELDALHAPEMLLESQTYSGTYLVNIRHGCLKGLQILVLLCLGGLVQRVRGTDSGNHILTLRIDQPLSIELVVSGGRVT